MNNRQNIAKAKAIEQANKKRLLAVNPKLDNESGIYFLTRVSENSADYLSALSTNFCKTVMTRLLKLRFFFLAISSNFAFKSFGIVMLVRVLSSPIAI